MEGNLRLRHKKGCMEIKNIKIKRGIFQGDSLSPLLFILAINPLSNLIKNLENGYRINARNEKKAKKIFHLFYMDDLKLYAPNREETTRQIAMVKQFSDDISMQFGLDKCAFITLRKGRRVESENIIMDQTTISQLDQESTYKYLGIEESEKVEHKKMKERLKKEYLKRIKVILKSELKAKNKIEAIRTFAVPVILYSCGIIDWYQEDLNQLDISTRKMLNAHKMMYKGQILSRIYTERVEGGMGMIELDQVYKKEIIGIGEYLEGATGKFIQWVYLHEMNKPDTTSIIKKKRDYLHSHNITTNQVQGWEEKILKFRMKYLKDRYGQERKQKHLNQWKNQAMAKKYRELLEEIYI